ncbi:MAG: DUF4040 domain-containing protein [Actinomycetota bacterium]|nr:DUF4040 domain-containing protein [Actinomycetota bacterium]
MTAILAACLLLVAAAGLAVVLTGDPARQALTLSALSLLLALLFLALEAPDVALSEIGIGTAIVPLMVMLAVRKIHAPGKVDSRSAGR